MLCFLVLLIMTFSFIIGQQFLFSYLKEEFCALVLEVELSSKLITSSVFSQQLVLLLSEVASWDPLLCCSWFPCGWGIFLEAL